MNISATLPLVGLLLVIPADPSGSSAASRAASDLEVKEVQVDLYDFGFKVSGPIDRSDLKFLFQNSGKATHEVVVIRLNPGVSAEAYVIAGQSGATTRGLGKPVKNIPPLKSGDQWVLSVKFRPGNYLLTCFVADESTGKSHLMLGMRHEFTIL